jgi:nuclear control of ATPase protein 2
VDIDQALSGIDKLLRSQELTFAFVGVAPAFAIVYLVGGYVRRTWNVVVGRGKYGGTRKRVEARDIMRWNLVPVDYICRVIDQCHLLTGGQSAC